MSRDFAIADTCFLIDWARYRHRDLLFRLFKSVFVPESVLRKVKSEGTISWIAHWLARGGLALYTEASDEADEARRLVEEARRAPSVIPVDVPEALCLAVGRRRGYVVLTENRGALMARDVIPGYGGVVVWRALEIITELQLGGHLPVDCSDPGARYLEYEEDTRHLFPRKDLSMAVGSIIGACGQGQGVGRG